MILRVQTPARFAATVQSMALCLLLACGDSAEPVEPNPAGPVSPGTTANPPAEANSPSTAEVELRHGLDLSVHSGTIDWPSLAGQGFDFVYLKATEGVDLADPAFAEHWQSAADHGLVRGAYHFYVTEDDPLEQAEFFISRVDLSPGDLLPVVDIEVIGHDTTPGLAGRLRTFLARIEEHYGVRPMIYTSPNFWDRHLDDTFGDHPLWIAEYEVAEPRVPAGWNGWTLWQYADDSEVAGVEKDADLNRLHADLDGTTLRIQAPSSQPPPL